MNIKYGIYIPNPKNINHTNNQKINIEHNNKNTSLTKLNYTNSKIFLEKKNLN